MKIEFNMATLVGFLNLVFQKTHRLLRIEDIIRTSYVQQCKQMSDSFSKPLNI